jgi:hypothetical protein
VTPFTVAIMQPYFLPYAGYFRLFAASDLFVIYDCVQFPRRGWVHRNMLVDAAGTARWLTLPLEKAPQSVLIRDLRFPPDANAQFAERLRPFPLTARDPEAIAPLLAALTEVAGTPVDYIARLLELATAYCGLRREVVRSSTLAIPADIHGQDRILEIARRLGAKRYVNAPGGRGLYDAAAFDQAEIELRFLTDYPGPTASILTRILRDDRHDLAADIKAATVLM